MKTTKILYPVVLAAAFTLSFTSCNDFLDMMPDNRTQLDTEDKISDLLANAYPSATYALVNELMSDNMDYYGSRNPNGDVFGDDTFFWRDEKEASSESMKSLWQDSYDAIAKSNQALVSLKEGDFKGVTADGIRAEALLCRAYNHFILVNQFAKAYNAQTSSKDLGVPISTQVEKITAKKERSSVAEVYAQVEKDIQEALPIVTDNYDVPKYHFNIKAAYAFAARFYLYYEKWDKAAEYATKCLGSNPAGVLRSWKTLSDLPDDRTVVTNYFVDKDVNANLLLSTYYSNIGYYLGAFVYYSRYSHGGYLAEKEDISAANIWGTARLYTDPYTVAGNNFDKSFILKIPAMFQYSDPVAHNGFRRTVLPILRPKKRCSTAPKPIR